VNSLLRAAAAELLARNGFSDAWRLGMRGDGRGQLTLASPSSAALSVVNSVLGETDAVRWYDDCGTGWVLRVVDEDETTWHAVAVSMAGEVRLLDDHFVSGLVRRVRTSVKKRSPAYLPGRERIVERLLSIRCAVRWWGQFVNRRDVMSLVDGIDLGTKSFPGIEPSEGNFVQPAIGIWSSWRYAHFQIPKTGWAPRLTLCGPALTVFQVEPCPRIQVGRDFIAAWRTIFTSNVVRVVRSGRHAA